MLESIKPPCNATEFAHLIRAYAEAVEQNNHGSVDGQELELVAAKALLKAANQDFLTDYELKQILFV